MVFVIKLAAEVLVIVAIGVGGALLTKAFHPRAPVLYLHQEPLREGEVTMDRVEGEWGGDVIWIDARQDKLYAKGHIPGAFLLNEQGWSNQLYEIFEQLQDATKPMVIYCDSRACKASHKIADRMRLEIGFENVWVLRGGWPEYRERQKEREKEEGC